MHTLELQAQDELLFKSLCCYYLLECSWDVNTFYKVNLSIFLTSMSITMSITMSIINMSLFFQNFDVIAKNTWHILVCFFAVCIIIISMFVTSVLDNLLLVLLIIIAKTYELWLHRQEGREIWFHSPWQSQWDWLLIFFLHSMLELYCCYLFHSRLLHDVWLFALSLLYYLLAALSSSPKKL